VAWRWVVGGPGSGKTERAVADARRAAAEGRRVAWIGLPAQRDQALRRLVADGPLLGVEFLTFQQLALLQLGRAGRLRPQILATARLALVAEALAERFGALPTPGEAGLFTRAIAEAKRHGHDPGRVATLAGRLVGGAGETARLAEVFAGYERLKGEAWDDDDVRAAAQAAARDAPPQVLRGWLPADLLVVDGWREVPPADLAWLRAIAESVDVTVTSVADPPVGWVDEGAIDRLAERPVALDAWRFANPVAEVRWVLRAVARDLAEGLDPRDLAVIAPPGAARALTALAGEFGVALADEAPRALVDLPYGRMLVDLLELPEHPTAGRLLAVPALAELGRRALAEGLTGREAIGRLAGDAGLATVWAGWLAALTPAADALAWAREVVALAADLMPGAGDTSATAAGPSGAAGPVARAQEAALRRAQEATRLAAGDGFRAWWLALLRASSLRERPRPGVALIEPRRAAGRRFRRAYLVGAVAGAYDLGEREDYFVPEEARLPPAALHEAGDAGLPRRYRGLDAAWRVELRARADHVTVTHADADRGGPLRADQALLGAAHGARAPALPSASTLEVLAAAAFDAPGASEPGGPTTVETLRRAQACAFQAWAAPLAEADPRAPWVRRARRALTAEGPWSDDRAAALAAAFPLLADWLSAQHDALARLSYGVRLRGEGTEARLDAVERDANRVAIVRFLLPGEEALAPLRPDLRWNELWAADLLRRRHAATCSRVDVVAWPLGDGSRLLTPDGVDTPALASRRRQLRRAVAEAQERWTAGPPQPSPGYRCGACPVADLCRAGTGAR
jgi:ATP-dependent helicase/nuclease subunit B